MYILIEEKTFTLKSNRCLQLSAFSDSRRWPPLSRPIGRFIISLHN